MYNIDDRSTPHAIKLFRWWSPVSRRGYAADAGCAAEVSVKFSRSAMSACGALNVGGFVALDGGQIAQLHLCLQADTNFLIWLVVQIWTPLDQASGNFYNASDQVLVVTGDKVRRKLHTVQHEGQRWIMLPVVM